MWGDLPPHLAGDFHSVVQLQNHSCRLMDSQGEATARWRIEDGRSTLTATLAPAVIFALHHSSSIAVCARHDHRHLAPGIARAVRKEPIVVAPRAVRARRELAHSH